MHKSKSLPKAFTDCFHIFVRILDFGAEKPQVFILVVRLHVVKSGNEAGTDGAEAQKQALSMESAQIIWRYRR